MMATSVAAAAASSPTKYFVGCFNGINWIFEKLKKYDQRKSNQNTQRKNLCETKIEMFQ